MQRKYFPKVSCEFRSVCICSLFRWKDDVNWITSWSKYFSTNNMVKNAPQCWLKRKIIEWMKQTVPQELTSANKREVIHLYALCSGHIHDHTSYPVISMIIYTSYRRTCQMWIQASSKKEVKHTVRVYSSYGHLYTYFVFLLVILNTGHFFLSLSRQVKNMLNLCVLRF